MDRVDRIYHLCPERGKGEGFQNTPVAHPSTNCVREILMRDFLQVVKCRKSGYLLNVQSCTQAVDIIRGGLLFSQSLHTCVYNRSVFTPRDLLGILSICLLVHMSAVLTYSAPSPPPPSILRNTYIYHTEHNLTNIKQIHSIFVAISFPSMISAY